MLSLVAALALLAAGPPDAPHNVKKPKTCDDQCVLIKDMCGQGCEKSKYPKGRTACEKTCKDAASACEGSCKERGRIDGEYMKKHLKVPTKKAASD